jgi:hypothetical protein
LIRICLIKQPNFHRVKYFVSRAGTQPFLHETLIIRNLAKRIHELDRKLTREFVSFNRISESIEKEGNQILELLLEPVFRLKQLAKARSQQQRDIARSFGTEERIGRLLEARSDALSDIARQQHELGKVR